MTRFFSILLIIFTIAFTYNFNNIQVNAKTLYKASEEQKITEVKASHILVDTKKEAEAVREEILAGKGFDQAAKEYSKCPSKHQGGDLGYFERGMMVPEFEKAAFALPVGEISEPVKTEFGWHLIMVTDRK